MYIIYICIYACVYTHPLEIGGALQTSAGRLVAQVSEPHASENALPAMSPLFANLRALPGSARRSRLPSLLRCARALRVR